MAAISSLTGESLDQLRALFDVFDADSDGLLEVEEVSAIWASCGVVLTDAEVLDMVTELKPDLRKLPFEEVRASSSVSAPRLGTSAHPWNDSPAVCQHAQPTNGG